MANPQAEDGHTDIANEILDALWKVNLSSYEWRVMLYILRKTYGWHKKADKIALSKFSKDIGINRFHVHRTIKKLVSKNLITVTQTGNSQILTYGFQKNYENWNLLPKQVTVTQTGNKTVTYLGTHKRKLKENLLRDPPDSRVTEFLKYHGEMFKGRFGATYKANFGKDGAIVKRLLKTDSLEDLKKYDEVFFRMKDPFIEGSGYTLGIFENQINKIVVESKKKESKW